jgi:hypothetical protein
MPNTMTTLRSVHRIMDDRLTVLLAGGRTGKIVRIDTVFPGNATSITVWLYGDEEPRVVKVPLSAIVGVAREA